MEVKLKRACGIKKTVGVKLGQAGEIYDLPEASAQRLIELGAADPVVETTEQAQSPAEESPPNYSSMTKAELQELLSRRGIESAGSFTKAELIALLEG